MTLRHLEINGGRVIEDERLRLALPANRSGYADAQIDDYGGKKRRDYPWLPGAKMQLRARFSHDRDALVGTAGFGFWNAPFGDPSVPWPALPQAAWFFFASKPTNLPLALAAPGRGWFVATLDGATLQARSLIPLAPFILLLNNVPSIRAKLWPAVRRRLGISFRQLSHDLTQWHSYQLDWESTGCAFWIDDRLAFATDCAPHGPLAFVCWLDNQYMLATPTGRFRSGTLTLPVPQWLEVEELRLTSSNRMLSAL